MTDENNTHDSEPVNDTTEDQQAAESGPAEPGAAAGPAEQQAAGSAARKGGNEVNLEALLKVPVSLSIEVGRKKMRLDDLLDTQEGSVIELDKLLNEPLDILVNGALIAHGVIVLAQERFGIQITDILSPEERARSL